MTFVGPDKALHVFGVTLIGVTPENGKKLLLTAAAVLVVLLVGRLLHAVLRSIERRERSRRFGFWSRQAVNLLTAFLVLLVIVSVWFDDPTRLTTALGLVTAGLAFAMQKVVTAIAGYFVILRGRTFNVGDRIVLGGVRGDVVALGFTQTTVMEMGQPGSVQNADPAMWVRSRQYTGRIVTVSNARIFDEPVYNYSRDFPFIFEEIALGIGYAADRARAERILLEAAAAHAPRPEPEAVEELCRRYFVEPPEVNPRVFWRMTDNWLELTLRFVSHDHGARELKDRLTREILTRFEESGLEIASATYEIVGLPPVRTEIERAPRRRSPGNE